MELFSVKRYDEEKPESDPEKEDEILQKLMKKVEKRKRKLDKERQHKAQQEQEQEQAPDGEVEDTNEHAAKKTRTDSPEKDEDMKDDEETEQKTEPTEEPQEELKDFQILGEDKIKKKQKVDMVLPPWLAYPTIVPNVISADSVKKNVDEITYLSPQLKANLKKMKFDTLFPVQEMVIPWIIEAHSKPFPYRPRDVCVSAPTGSGKTLAFAVPVVQLLLERVEPKIRALVVLPVNELALQVFDVFKRLCFRTELKTVLLTKSNPFRNEQASLVECYKGKYYSKVDIIVTTPGRLVEHLNATKGLCFKDLKFLVVDEADRIMEQAHHNWLYHLEEHMKAGSDRAVSGRLPPLCLTELEHYACKQPHKLLYSATLSSDPEKLQNLRLFQPKLFTSVVKSVDDLLQEYLEKQNTATEKNKFEERRGEFIGKYTTPAELTEKYCITESSVKPLTLFGLISTFKWEKFLCFANSADTAHRLAFVLQDLVKDKLKIEELSAHLKPNVRKNILNQFILGKVNGLICSDALTRGIDIPAVDVVISYDAPRHIKTYIHRIGRTARAGRKGTAVTLLAPQEEKNFQKIINEAGKESVEEIKLDTEFEEVHARELSMSIKRLKKALTGEAHFKEIKEKLLKGKAEPSTQEGENEVHAGELQSQLADGILFDLNQTKQIGPKSWLSSCKEENKSHKLRKNVKRLKSIRLKAKQKKRSMKTQNGS